VINNDNKTTQEQIQLRQKMKQQWDILTQYAQDLHTEIPKDFILEMEQCLQITDNNSQLIIHDYKTFAQVLMTY
jgi:hypothetical protein